MLFAWWVAYGGRPIGGFAPGGIFTGHIENSAHYEGRAVDISFATSDPDNNRRGWLLAHWLVAQADYLQIATVIFDDHLWSALHSAWGWRPYTHPSGNTTDPTLRHLNHIHVDVEHGLPAGPPPYVAEQEARQAARDGIPLSDTEPATKPAAAARPPATPVRHAPTAPPHQAPARAQPAPPAPAQAQPAPPAPAPGRPAPAPPRSGIPPLLPPVG
jgi:hypothetical protein